MIRTFAILRAAIAALALSGCGTAPSPGVRAAVAPKTLETLEARRPAEPVRSPGAQPLPYTPYGTDFAAAEDRRIEDTRPVVEVVPAFEPAEPGPVRRPRDGTLRVAVLAPAVGPAAATGAELKNAAMLALFNARSDGVMLQFYDSKGTSGGAMDAARAALSDGAGIIVGPLLSEEVRGVRAASPDVPVISFTTDREVLSKGVFSIGFLLDQQVRRLVEFAVASGKPRIALLLPKSDTGGFIRSGFVRYAGRFGAEIVADESYGKGALMDAARRLSDFDARQKEYREYAEEVSKRLDYMRALKDSDGEAFAAAYDAERYASSYDELAALEREQASLAKKTTISDPGYGAVFVYGDDISDVIMAGSALMYFDVHPGRVKFMGTSQLENPKVYSERSFRGAWYPSISTRYGGQFEAAYRKYFGAAPGRLASLSYDAVALAAMMGAGVDSEALLNPNGWTGINGIFRFRPDGSSERNMDVREIVGGASVKTKVVSPAADSFVGN